MDRAVPFACANWIKRVCASVLIFALVFPFPLVTYAQEAESAPVESQSEEAPISLDMPANLGEDSSTQELEGGEDPEPQALMAGGGGQATDASIQTLEPQFYTEPDPMTGSLVYEYDLSVPSGRNGMQPDLSLQYTSQSSENIGAFGYGWNINIPYIERDNDNGTEKLFSQTYFRSSIDGEIVPASTTNSAIYGARVENGSFNQYQYSSTTGWVMTDKKGIQYIFGTSTSGRIDNPSNSSQVFRWMLQEIRDTNGNYVSYQYSKDRGQIYPYKITYTNYAAAAGKFEVEFLNEARPDVATSSNSGFSIISAKRINEIQIKVDGSWVRKYVLGYGTGDNGVRSMLVSVTESGRDEAGAITTLPAAAFQYETVNKGWTLSNITSPIYFSNYTSLADVNGDSLVDIIASEQYLNSSGQEVSAARETYINNGNGWTASSTWRTPMFMYISVPGGNPPNTDRGVRFGDVNGDGLTDLIQSWDEDPNTTKTYLNTGAGWATSTSWVAPVQFTGTSWAYEFGTRLVDVNGDGLTDLVNNSSVYINTGNDWMASSTWTTPYADLAEGKPVQFEDINGDGLVDLVYSQGGSLWSEPSNHVYINTGNGWTQDNEWVVPIAFIDYQARDEAARMGDANGDGLMDIIQSPAVYGTSTQVYLNTGHAWVPSPDWNIPINFTINLEPSTWLVDVNGDGLIDLVRNKDTVYNEVYLNNTNKTDLLIKVTHPQGGTTSFGYAAAAEYTSGSTKLNKLPFSIITVSTTTVSDGLGAVATTSYSYQGGHYHVASSTDRRFGGFQKVVKTDPVGNITNTYFHQGNTTSSSTGEYIDHSSKIGKVYRTEAYDNTSDLYSKSVARWDKTSLGSNRDFVKLAQQVDFAYDGDADHKDKGVAYTYDNATGNLIQKIEYGEVSGSDDGTFSDTGSDLASTTYAYVASTTIKGLPSSELSHNQSAAKVRESHFYYDNQSLGNALKGNLTKEEKWITASTYASTTKTYDGTYGLVTQERDPNYNLTTYTLDSANLYPATSTNALSQATGFVYDYSSGKAKQTYNPNGRLHTKVYDGLDRELAVLEPDPTTGIIGTTTAYTYTDSNTPGATAIQETKYFGAATTTALYTYFDGLNRKLQERKQAENANTYAVRDWTYNTRGLLASESLPYFASGSARSGVASSSSLFTNYAYDALKRITTLSNTLGDTTNAYDQWAVTTTDAENNVKVFAKDAYDNLIQVDEHNNGDIYTTLYEYDRNNNLTKITDEEGNVRNFTYDGLSRRLTAQDLHDVVDGGYGTWTYTYDAAGNLLTSLDPKSQTVQYTYDALNRALTENYTGAGGTEVTYGYDSCADGVGRLCAATSTDAATALQYNALGLVKKESRTISSTTYATEYVYDRQGNQTLLTMPDSSQVQYTYNNAGLVESVAYRNSGGSFADIVSDFDYAPTGKATYKAFANCVESYYTYDATKLYRLTRIFTTAENCEGESFMGGGGDMSFMGSEAFAVFADLLEPFEEELVTGSEVLGTTTEPAVEVVTEEAVSTEIATSSEEIAAATSTPEIVESVASTSNETKHEDKKEDKKSVADLYAQNETIKGKYRLENNALVKTKDDTRVTVGDKNASEFTPTFTLEKWGETKVTVTPELGTLSAPEAKFDGDKVVYGDNKTQARFYELPKSETLPDSGYEIDVVLAEKPKSNVVSFAIDSENLDFFYQPALNEDEGADGLECTATQCVDSEGQVVLERPEHVVGSYAAYYKDGVMHSKIGGKDYKTGKAFHIYRPKISDSAGNEVWGTLAIKKGKLTVTVPEEFLESAIYPIIVDPTFGYGAAGGSSHTNNQDILASKQTSPSDMGTVTSVSFYMQNSQATNRSAKGVILASSTQTILTNGVSSAATIAPVSTVWATSTFGTAPTLSASTAYLLGAICNTSFCSSRYDSGSNGDGWADTSNDYATPTNPTDGSQNNRRYSVYVTYTAVSGGNNAPTEPTSLLAEGQTNPANITDSTPEFSAIYNDPDATSTAAYYQIQVSTSSVFASTKWDSTKTVLASSTPPGMRIADIAYGGTALASSTTYYWRIKFWDQLDAQGAWSTTTATFTLASSSPANSAPTAPTAPLAEGLTNPTNVTDSTPEFSAIYVDPDVADQASKYRIQVATSSVFTSIFWDSGTTTMATTSQGARSPDISYAGSALASSTTYYWRVAFVDVAGAGSAWSTTTASFSLAAAATTSPSFVEVIQDINFTYDDVGNITQIVDRSDTGAGKVVTYQYDDLYRLLSASTTAASSTPYHYAYTYNSLGNIMTAVALGATSTYIYAETGYANPHAPTSVGGVTHAYDNNGNLTGAGSTGYAWDYRNRMSATGSGGATTTYAYDHTEQRVKKVSGATTTIYPNKFYDVTGSTINKSIFAGGELVATVGGGSGGSGSSTMTSFFSDSGGDGEVYTGGAVWDTQHDATSGTADGAATTAWVYSEPGGANYWIGRMALPFDTSAIPDGATITSATLKVYVDTKTDSDNDANAFIRVVQNTTASATALDNGDYDQIGSIDNPTAGASDTDITGISSGAYLSIPLNSTGLSWINKTGHTKLGLREGHDATDTAPNVSGITGMRVRTANTAGTSQDPILEITYQTGSSGPTTINYVHTDHLGGTNVTTNDVGEVASVSDYYPFGAERISTGDSGTDRGYIGQEYDEGTQMSYLQARYYKNDRGQFISIDPVFYEVGLTQDGKAAMLNPQLLNSYSYAGNNPIVNKDPTGRYLESGFDIAMLGLSIHQFYQDPSWANAGGVLLDAGSLALPGVPAVGGMAIRAGKAAEATYSVYQGVDAAADVRYIGITSQNPLERFAQHSRSLGTGKENLAYEVMPGMSGLTKNQARLIEQSYINNYGLQKNGGVLLNKINSISPTSNLGQSISGSLSNIQKAFAPTNSAQANALKNLSKAFGRR